MLLRKKLRLQLMLLEEHFQVIKGKIGQKHQELFVVTERKTDLAKLEALDCGIPLDEPNWDIDDVAGCFEYFVDLAEGLNAKQKASISLPMESFKSYVLKQPLGVVGLITP